MPAMSEVAPPVMTGPRRAWYLCIVRHHPSRLAIHESVSLPFSLQQRLPPQQRQIQHQRLWAQCPAFYIPTLPVVSSAATPLSISWSTPALSSSSVNVSASDRCESLAPPRLHQSKVQGKCITNKAIPTRTTSFSKEK